LVRSSVAMVVLVFLGLIGPPPNAYTPCWRPASTSSAFASLIGTLNPAIN
jgi:hypothetical protein